MMISKSVQDAVNEQIKHEFEASYLYLGMANWCDRKNLKGFAKWLQLQSQEEYGHGMKLIELMREWGATVELKNLSAPPVKWNKLLDVFKEVLEHERSVTQQINKIYELTTEERAYAAQAQLQWFLVEQVEEESTSEEIVAKLELAGEDPAALLVLDSEMASRDSGGTGATGV